jgi:hypothetical protein
MKGELMRELRLVWRSPARDDGGRGYADWVRALRRGRSGVYLIRHFETHEVLYIGESHRDRLYDTLTRHLQSWSGFGSGPTYYPGRVQVAVVETEPEEAPYLQFELIQQFQPADNVQDGRSLFMPGYDHPEETADDEVPF